MLLPGSSTRSSSSWRHRSWYATSSPRLRRTLTFVVVPSQIAGIVCSLLNAILPEDPDSLIHEAEDEDDILVGHVAAGKRSEDDADVKMA